MQAGEVRDDGGFPAAAFANNRTAIRFGGGIVTVKACLNSSNRSFEQWIFDEDTFGPVHRVGHWLSSVPQVSFEGTVAETGTRGRSRSASKIGRVSSSVKVSGQVAIGSGAASASGQGCLVRAAHPGRRGCASGPSGALASADTLTAIATVAFV